MPWLFTGRERHTSLVWEPMRPTITCPNCGRRGRVQRRLGTKPHIEHRCPGPFTLTRVEEASSWKAGFLLTCWSGPHVGTGGDWR